MLAAPVDDAQQVVRSLVAVQAENPSQSAWAVATRTSSPSQGDLAAALADGRVLRTHVLRSTWHYVHADDVQWLQDLTSPRVRPIFEQQLHPIADRMDALTEAVEQLLAAASDRTRNDIAGELADRGEQLTGFQLMLLLGFLELEGLVTSGAPRDGEHTYALFADRVPEPRRLDRDDALAEIARRYFTSHGPATERDLAYWATLTVTDVRRGIAGAADELASFDHDGRTFWHAPGEAPASASPAGHLLQVLDEMYRGYQDSRWVIDADAHRAARPRVGDRHGAGRGAARRGHEAHGGCEGGHVRDPAASHVAEARDRGDSGCRGAVRRVPRAGGARWTSKRCPTERGPPARSSHSPSSELLELGDQHAAFGIAHDGLAQSRRRPSVGGVAEHVGDRRRDALRARRSRNRDARPSCGDAYGVVGLIAAVVQDDERHPRGERLDDGAVAAVRDDEVDVRQHEAVRCGCHDSDIRGRAEHLGLDRRPGRDETSNRKARRAHR